MTARLLHWISRVGLGAVFVYAGFVKVYPRRHQLAFAMDLSTYQLLPEWAVVLVAETLPWMEILLGLALWSGWKLRYFAAFTGLLLTGFISVMLITYARGIEANCGCFGPGEAISPYTLLRDSLILAPALYLAITSWRQAGASPAAS